MAPLILLVLALVLVFAAAQFFLLGRRGMWKLTALLPVVVLAVAGCVFWPQWAATTGWERLERELQTLVFWGGAGVGILLGALLWGVLALLSRLGER